MRHVAGALALDEPPGDANPDREEQPDDGRRCHLDGRAQAWSSGTARSGSGGEPLSHIDQELAGAHHHQAQRVALVVPVVKDDGGAGGEPAQDRREAVAAGRSKAAQCAVCHGIDGLAKQPLVPNLAGNSEIYLKKQLDAFRAGKRQHEQMTIIAQGLSDQDVADLVAWYSGIKVTVELPPGN